MMQIEIDEATGEIVVGNWRVDGLRIYRHNGTTPGWKQWVKQVAEANNVHLPHTKKEFNKAAADLFKRSPTSMYEHFKKLSYKQFVVPYKDVLVKVAFRRGSIDIFALKDVKRNYAVAKETFEDGLHNILPLVVKTGKRPAELKKEFGAKWKVMANNSLNKNKALMKKVDPKDFGKFCDKPTTLIHQADRFYSRMEGDCTDFFNYAAQHLKGIWGNRRKLEHEFTLFRDTSRMSEQLNVKFDPKWTPRRMKEEHDKMSQEINARRYPKTPYESVENVPVKEYVDGEYTAVLLESGFDIAEEGTLMGHCVGGYASRVKSGHYLVYSVRKNGERTSTIGLNITTHMSDCGQNTDTNKWKSYKFSQHYARFNGGVTCEVEASIPGKILELLNKKEVV